MKKLVTLVALVFLATFLFSQEAASADNRGMYIALGGGPARVEYPEPFQSLVDTLNSVGYEQLTIDINLSVGGALNKNTYIIGSFSWYADSWDLDLSYYRLYTIFYSVGFRYYPYTTGLVLGVDAGATNMNNQSSVAETIESDYGLGLNASIGYDFDKNSTGLTFILGAQVGLFDIEGDDVMGFGIFGNVAWKERLRR